jgi:hypothetical protein
MWPAPLGTVAGFTGGTDYVCRMLRSALLFATLLLLAVTGAGCGDDGGDDDESVTVGAEDDAGDESGEDESGEDDEGATGDDDAGASNAGDLQVVWDLPPGEFTVWLPYQLIDDELQYSESASFQTTSVSMDEVLAFYRDYFPTIGLEIDELELGESVAMNLTKPDDPLWTGVMQTGVDPEGAVTVSQNYTDPKESGDTTTTDPAAESTSGEGGAVAGDD